MTRYWVFHSDQCNNIATFAVNLYFIINATSKLTNYKVWEISLRKDTVWCILAAILSGNIWRQQRLFNNIPERNNPDLSHFIDVQSFLSISSLIIGNIYCCHHHHHRQIINHHRPHCHDRRPHPCPLSATGAAVLCPLRLGDYDTPLATSSNLPWNDSKISSKASSISLSYFSPIL